MAASPQFLDYETMIFSYRHPERSRGIFLVLRSLSYWRCQGNDALVLRISAFSHPSFIALQRRFLASLEMTIQESHQSLIPGYSPLLSNFWRYPFPVSSSRAQPRDLSCTCGYCHIGTARETTPWCFVFLLSHTHHLSVCKEDFSLRSK